MAKAKANKSFKDWEAEEVELTFGINRLHSMPFIDHLKSIKLPVPRWKRCRRRPAAIVNA